jgi:EmrB/QacA subfamily drug resistance transporter
MALAVLCIAQLLVILDGSIVAVALPAIRRDLGFTEAGLAWVVNGYLVAFGGLLLLAGRLGDAVGARRLLTAGLGLFSAASVACAVAPAAALLVAARFVQGAGAAMASAVTLGIIVALYPEADERGRALGAFSFAGAAGSSLGLLAGGVLVDLASWRAVFLIAVPIAAAAAIVAVRVVPLMPDSAGTPSPVDAILAVLGVGLLVYALLATGSSWWRWSVPGGVAAAALIAFLMRQRNAALPLLPLSLLRHREVGFGNLTQALIVAALFGFQFLGIVYLQQQLHYTPLRAGLAYLPVAVLIAAMSMLVTPRLLARHGSRRILLCGIWFTALGLAWLSRLPAQGHYVPDVLPSALLIAVGFGAAFPALAAVAVGGAPAAYASTASGLFGAAQQVGGALGLALQTSLLGSGPGIGFRHAFTAATALAAAATLPGVLAGQRHSAGGDRLPGLGRRSQNPLGDAFHKSGPAGGFSAD